MSKIKERVVPAGISDAVERVLLVALAEATLVQMVGLPADVQGIAGMFVIGLTAWLRPGTVPVGKAKP